MEELADGAAPADAAAAADAAAPADAPQVAPDAARPTVIATSPFPVDLAMDESYLYWTDCAEFYCWPFNTSGSVRRVSKAGGTVEVLASDQFDPYHLVVDDTHVYWTTADSVMRMRKDGSDKQVIDSGVTSRIRPIAVDQSFVYYASWGIRRAPKTGGPVEVLYMDVGDPIENRAEIVLSLVVDDQHVYWTNEGGIGGIYRVPKSGGEPEYFYASAPAEIVVQSGYVYWQHAGVRRQHRDAMYSDVLFPPDMALADLGAITVRGDTVFWGHHGGYPLYAGNHQTGEWQVLVEDNTVVSDSGLEADGKHVYWIDQGELAILRVPWP